MFKGMLAIIIITSCGTLGMIKSISFNQRVRQLNQLRDTICILKTEITYRKDSLPVIFRRISSQRSDIASEILERCCLYMGQRHTFEQCWESAVSEVCNNSSLKGPDKAIISDLGVGLGKSSIQGQIDMFSMAEEKLALQIEEAIKEKNSKGKMYGGLGFSIGIVIAVLLI